MFVLQKPHRFFFFQQKHIIYVDKKINRCDIIVILLCRSILDGVTRILDINTDTGVSQMKKVNATTDTEAAEESTEKVKKVTKYLNNLANFSC